MKKIILSLAIISAAFVSCKKDKAPGCEISVQGITANYKITKVEIVSASGNSDVTTTFLDACKQGALYQLKTDKTVIYTEAGSSCTGSGNGTWNVANNQITIVAGTGFQFANAPIESWNCSTLVITQSTSFGGTTVNARFTFTKQ